MKTTATTLIVFLLVSLYATAKCPWSITTRVYNGGIIVAEFDEDTIINFLAIIAPSDSVTISGYGDFGNCGPYFRLTHNEDTILYSDYNDFHIVLNDTGHYHLYFHNLMAIFWNRDLNISYGTTGVQNNSKEEKIQFYQIESNIYRIENLNRLKLIFISDAAGRIVYESSDLHEVNLSPFSSGIYYYGIVDENDKVWSGKLLKD
jgi:hypothetical protein